MKTVESHALQLGSKINEPFIDESFYPVAGTKYITFHAQKNTNGKNYSYMQDVLDLIIPHLLTQGIQIIQVGYKEDAHFSGVEDMKGKLDSLQISYLLRNSLCHFGTDGFFNDIAAFKNTKLVNITSTTPASYCEPIWGKEDKVSIEPDIKNSYSFRDSDSENNINKISPEKIAKEVLDFCAIKDHNLPETLHMGKYFCVNTVEVVPNFNLDRRFLAGKVINIRADYHHDERNIANLCMGRKANIVINKPISLKYLSLVKDYIKMINIEATDEISIDFLKKLKKMGINIFLFTKDEDRLQELRFKFLDWNLEFNKRKTKKDLDLPESIDNLKYRSSKITISNGKKYSSTADYKKDLQFGEGDGSIIDNDDFWEELDHFKIYK